MKAPWPRSLVLIACLLCASSSAALHQQRSLTTVHSQRKHSKKHGRRSASVTEAEAEQAQIEGLDAVQDVSEGTSNSQPTSPLQISSEPVDRFQEALKLANKPDGPGGRVVMMVTVQEYMARMHLPIFLQSLKQAGNFHKHVIVVTFDDAAHRVCQKVHDPRLCVPEVVEEEINGKRLDDLHDEHGHKSTKWLVGWMKTKLTQRTLFSGYDCIFTDIDMVFFKDPFKAIDWQADVAVTNDCEDGYHPKWDKREHAMGNLGLTYFKNNENAKAVLAEWLGRAGPDTWDQWELKHTMEHQSEINPTLWVQMLERDQWGNFCCNYCNKLVDMVVGRYKGWMEWCPLEQRQGWIMFHVACIKEHWGYGNDDHDETLEKRDAMLAVWEAGMQDRDNRFFHPLVNYEQM